MTINYSKNIFKDKIVEKTGANPNFMEFQIRKYDDLDFE